MRKKGERTIETRVAHEGFNLGRSLSLLLTRYRSSTSFSYSLRSSLSLSHTPCPHLADNMFLSLERSGQMWQVCVGTGTLYSYVIQPIMGSLREGPEDPGLQAIIRRVNEASADGGS